MAKQEIVEILLKLSDGNTIPLMAKKAKKAKKEMEGLGGAAQGTDRRIKGVTQQSSNASKNFSKQAQTMQGGVVAVYATIAAQVFAVSAAFQFLKDAMETRNLMEGQLAFGAVTGVAYKSLTRDVQAATGGMLQFKEAAQAVAIGTAGGLSAGQLERLGQAALNTSLALGRDLTDSFNRLVRGVTKAEPELLDELGIILRLEPALKNYAAEIGKSVSQLSQFEKSQAIANEVLDQAESKFGMMSLLMDDSAFALQQFQKTFDDLMNSLKKGVGDIAGKVLPFFTDNIMALVGAMALFLAPILKSLLPDFAAMAAAKKIQADSHIADMEREKIAMMSFQKKQREMAGTKDKLRMTAAPELDAQSAKMGIKGGMRGKARAIAHYEKQTTQLISGEIKKRTGLLAAQEPKEVALLKKKYQNMDRATATWAAKTKAHFTGVTNFASVQWTRMKGLWAGTLAGMSKLAGGFAKVMNVAMRAMGWAGIILMIYQGIQALRKWIRGTDEAREKEAEFFEETAERYGSLSTEMDRMSQARKRGFVQGDELVSQIGASLKNLDIQRFSKEWNELMATKPDAFDTAQLKKWQSSVDLMKDSWASQVEVMGKETWGAVPSITAYGDVLEGQVKIGEDVEKATRLYTNALIDQGQFIDKAAERNKSLKKAILEVTQAMGSEKYGNILDQKFEEYQGQERKMGGAYGSTQVGPQLDLQKQQLNEDLEAVQERMNANQEARRQNIRDWNRKERDNWSGRQRQIQMSTLPDDMFDEQATYMEKSAVGYYTNLGGGVAKYRKEMLTFDNQANDLADEMERMLDKKFELEDKEEASVQADKELEFVKSIFNLQKDISQQLTNKNKIQQDSIQMGEKLFAFSTLETKNHKEDMKNRTAANALFKAENSLTEIKEAALVRELDLEEMIHFKQNNSMEDYLDKYKEQDRANLEKFIRDTEALELEEKKVVLTRTQVAEAKILNQLSWEAKEQKWEEVKATKALVLAQARNALDKEDAVGYDEERLNFLEKMVLEYEKTDIALTKAINAEAAWTKYTAERIVNIVDANGVITGQTKNLLYNEEKSAELAAKKVGFVQDYLKLMQAITAEMYKQSGQSRLSDIEDKTSKGKTKFTSMYGDGEGRFGRGFGVKGAWKSGLNIQGRAYAEERGNMGYATDAAMQAGEKAKMIKGERARLVSEHFADRKPSDISAKEITDFEASLKLNQATITEIEAKADNLPTALRQATDAATDFAVELELAESIENTIENGFVSMFQAMVDGTKSFGDAMKDLMKQVLADLAAAYLKAAALKFMMAMGFSTPGARYGGELSGPGYAAGGVANGPNSGYMATLHGREAVVPLGNDRSIPVDIRGASGNIVNVSISMQGGQSQTSVSGGGDMQALGRSIGGLVQQHLQVEMRPGGLLNRQGAKGRV